MYRKSSTLEDSNDDNHPSKKLKLDLGPSSSSSSSLSKKSKKVAALLATHVLFNSDYNGTMKTGEIMRFYRNEFGHDFSQSKEFGRSITKFLSRHLHLFIRSNGGGWRIRQSTYTKEWLIQTLEHFEYNNLAHHVSIHMMNMDSRTTYRDTQQRYKEIKRLDRQHKENMELMKEVVQNLFTEIIEEIQSDTCHICQEEEEDSRLTKQCYKCRGWICESCCTDRCDCCDEMVCHSCFSPDQLEQCDLCSRNVYDITGFCLSVNECDHCDLLVCQDCDILCENRQHSHSHRMEHMCNNCVAKCGKCGVKSCPDCIDLVCMECNTSTFCIECSEDWNEAEKCSDCHTELCHDCLSYQTTCTTCLVQSIRLRRSSPSENMFRLLKSANFVDLEITTHTK